MRLAALSPEAARGLQMTGLLRHFPVFPTVRAAVTDAGVPRPGPAGDTVSASPAPGAQHPGPAAPHPAPAAPHPAPAAPPPSSAAASWRTSAVA